MVTTRYISYLLCLAMLVSISGCARYHAQPLQPLLSTQPIKKTPHVVMSYKIFATYECETFLGRNVLFDYQPIQISIHNHSNNPIYFSPQSISLPTVPTSEVIKMMQNSPCYMSYKYFIHGLFIAPLAFGISILGAKVSLFSCKMIGILVCGSILATPIILLAGCMEAYNTFSSNRSLAKDYNNKALCAQVINPMGTINGLIFVSKWHFYPELSITIIDQVTNKSYLLSTRNPVADV